MNSSEGNLEGQNKPCHFFADNKQKQGNVKKAAV